MLHWQSKYHPQSHQARFHQLETKYKWFLAGVGAGKTLAGTHEAVYLANDNPTCDGLIVAPTFPMFRDVILPLWQDWIPQHLYHYNKSEHYFLWYPTRRTIFVRSATEPDLSSGLNIGWFWFDEAGLVQKDKLWKILLARLRQRGQRNCGFVTSTGNGMNWLARWFRSHPEAGVIRCRTADNKMLPDDFEPGLRASYGEEYARAYLDAEIISLQGLAWPILARVHCALPFEEMKKRVTRHFGGVDWGYTNPACVIIGGMDQENRWYLLEEWYKRGQTRETIAKKAQELQIKWGVKQWYIDHDPEGELWMNRLGMNVLKAEKKPIVSGLQHVRTLLAVRNDGQPHLYVAAHLKEWMREQEGYVFPEENEEPEGMNGDHAMDTTRYMIYTNSLHWNPPAEYSGVDRSRVDKESRDWSNY